MSPLESSYFFSHTCSMLHNANNDSSFEKEKKLLKIINAINRN